MRLIFRKVGKGLDQKNTKLATAQAQIQKLQFQVDHLRPRKRQKVDENPNKRFIQIQQGIGVKTVVRELYYFTA